MAKNKVKFGLKNVHVWKITNESQEATIYGDVIKIPGAVNLALNAEGDSNSFYADDIVYYSEFSNNGYSGDLEVALIPDEFLTQILGQLLDDNGALVEMSDAKSSSYAIAFEFDGDVHKTRHIMYRCNSSRPSVEGETKKESTDPKTETISINAMGTMDKGLIKAKVKQGQTGYDTFFEAPYEPVITPSV